LGLKSINDKDGIYFLTSTIVDWIDIFTRPIYRQIIIRSLSYCQDKKGLIVYAWVLMSNHLHLICSAKEGYELSDIIRDFKKFTSMKMINAIKEENESRREWILDRFEYACKYKKKIKHYQVWQEGNDPQLLYSDHFLKQKMDYIHNNPVKAELVLEPEHYVYSSACDYAGQKGFLNVELIFVGWGY
jgi:putative transposase